MMLLIRNFFIQMLLCFQDSAVIHPVRTSFQLEDQTMKESKREKKTVCQISLKGIQSTHNKKERKENCIGEEYDSIFIFNI